MGAFGVATGLLVGASVPAQAAAAVITTGTVITNGQQNVQVIVASPSTFKTDVDLDDFIIDENETGLEAATVTRNWANQVTIGFTGTAVRGSTPAESTLSIIAKGGAGNAFDLVGGEPAANSDELEIEVPVPVISTPNASIVNGVAGPEILINSTTPFRTNAQGLSQADFTPSAATGSLTGNTGLTLSTATFVTANQVRLTFTGTPSQAANLGAFRIAAAATAFATNSGAPSAALNFAVAVPVITTPNASVVNGVAGPEILINSTTPFRTNAQGLSQADFTPSAATGSLTGNTGLTLSTATFVTANQVRLTFTGTPSQAANLGAFRIAAAATAFATNSGAPSAALDFAVAAPVISTTSTLVNGQLNPSIVVTSTSTFKTDVALANFTIAANNTGLTGLTIARNSGSQVTIGFTGTATRSSTEVLSTLSITATGAAFDPDAGANSNVISVVVPAPTPAPTPSPSPSGGGGGTTGGGSTGTTTTPVTPVPAPTPTPTPTTPVTPSQPNAVQVAINLVESLSPAQVSRLGARTLATLPPAAFGVMTGNQVAALRPTQVSGFTARQIAAITPAAIAKMKPETLAAFSNKQIRGLTARDAKALTQAQLAALSTSQRQIVERKRAK